MKIHIVKPTEQTIENFERVEITQDGLELSQYANNECEFIFANEVLDMVNSKNLINLLNALIAKLRIGGALVVGGTDLRVLSKQIINCKISEHAASDIISGSAGLYNLEYIVNTIKENTNLTIESSTINGTHYEIRAVRPKVS